MNPLDRRFCTVISNMARLLGLANGALTCSAWVEKDYMKKVRFEKIVEELRIGTDTALNDFYHLLEKNNARK